MTEKDEVYALYRHNLRKQGSKWYAVNKTASMLSIDVETVEAIIEEAESDDD